MRNDVQEYTVWVGREQNIGTVRVRGMREVEKVQVRTWRVSELAAARIAVAAESNYRRKNRSSNNNRAIEAAVEATTVAAAAAAAAAAAPAALD